MIKTRFAPSPTGFLHVGGLRTALFAYLFAKNQGGKFLLRVEDTDKERFIEGGIENILDSLHWAGIKPDEGVDLQNGKVLKIGDNGPYIQSERLKIYKKYVDELVNKNEAYYCFCSKERLEELRETQELSKQATGYDGLCLNIESREVKRRLANGEKYVVRMKMPQEGKTEFTDLVRGKVEFKNEFIDDQIILKADGYPTYHLAVVVDDHLMEISHVIRGEEWLSSTPKHLQLYKALGWHPPQFAHLSLLVNAQKQKLSKRHGDVAVRDYREKGYLPEALLNFIAFLGWNPGDEREIFSLKELVKEFSFDKVSKAAAVFNLKKLDWYNQKYMRTMALNKLTETALPFFFNSGLVDEKVKKVWLQKVVGLEKERASTLSGLVEEVAFIFSDKLDYEAELLVWKKNTREKTKQNLANLSDFLANLDDFSKAGLETKVGEWLKENSLNIGDVLWPLRVALSGQKNSPGPYQIAEVLGKEKTLARVGEAVKKL